MHGINLCCSLGPDLEGVVEKWHEVLTNAVGYFEIVLDLVGLAIGLIVTILVNQRLSFLVKVSITLIPG